MTQQLNGPGLAAPADRETLADIWEQSFHDPKGYIQNFLTLAARNRNTVVYREDGRVVSAVYLLPGTLYVSGEPYNAYYFYAAATHPDYRRRGYMEQLIRYCRTLCEVRNVDFLILVPADNNLYQYYSRFGFRANFYLKTTRMSRTQLTSLTEKLNGSAERPEGEAEEEAAPVAFTPTEIPAVRKAALSSGTFLDFPEQTLQYMLFEHVYCGGKTLLTDTGYVLYSVEEDDAGDRVLTVKELCSTEGPGPLLQELLKEETDTFLLNLPAFDTIRGGRTSTGRAGMDLAVSKRAVIAERTMKNAYIGLTLG